MFLGNKVCVFCIIGSNIENRSFVVTVCKTTNATETLWDHGRPIHIPDPNKDCVFPYTFLRKKYLKCTNEHAFNGIFWCGTEYNATDKSGWGMCNDYCPKEFSKNVIEHRSPKGIKFSNGLGVSFVS